MQFAEGYEVHLERMALLGRDVKAGGVAGTRLRYDLMGERMQPPRPAGMRVRNTFAVLEGHEIPLRVYWPADVARPPVILYLHGGGFIAGSPDSHDMITAALAEAAGAAVVSVHYRRCPENPCPAPQEDCYAALLHVVAEAEALEIDAGRLAVAGDSAGGLLSTAVAMMARDRSGPAIRHQSMIYGVFDFDMERPYYKTAQETALTLARMRDLSGAYWGYGTPIASPITWPLRAPPEALRGLPPAFFLNGGYDSLLQEEEEYAALLASAGVRVRSLTVPGVMHGFLRALDVSPPVHAAFLEMVADIREHLA
jgi:acetyl esterase